MSEIYRSLKKDERRVARDSAKEGTQQARFTLVLKDTGRYTVSEPLNFGVAFTDKPDVSKLVESELWDDIRAFPTVEVGVREWITDEAGHYIGAYVWAMVT